MQKKDVIYIDVEDDITAIIGKVKGAKEKIVALVPPKRTGVFQSAVNLRLLARTADKAGKRLVLITGNSSLASLAATAKIPVAKNLQSAPKLADMVELDEDEEDVIEGNQLPVGEHAGLKDDDAEEIIVPEDLEALNVDDAPKPIKPARGEAAKAKNRIKVPDFGTFRKKMAFAAVGGVLLIAFLFWAFAIAPHATIVVSAKTTPVDIDTTLSIGDSLSTDSSKNTLATTTQTDKQTGQSVQFDVTGTKDVGTKASGTVVFMNSDNSADVPLSAGTYISSGGNNYVLQSQVTVPGATIKNKQIIPGQSSAVQVIATDIGSDYNTPANAIFSAPGDLTATSSAGISGGDKHTAKVVTADDVQNALDQIKQQNTDAEKKKILDEFSKDVKSIDSSFTMTTGTPQLSPGIGEEVTSGNKAKVTVDVTYSMIGIDKSVLEDYLNSAINDQLGNDNQKRIYDNGASLAQFSEYQAAGDNNKPATVRIKATGQVGIKIDDNQIKDQVKGRRSGEVIGNLKSIDGVSDVDVKLSPFWVSGVPDDVKKITIEFKLLTNG